MGLFKKSAQKRLTKCFNCTIMHSTDKTERNGGMITINYRDGRPIYEQVKDSLRRLILTGSLPPDDKLPSVRQMATELAINPNTIARAYRELEAEGYLYSVPGKGCFVAAMAGRNDARINELLEAFDKMAEELQLLGLSAQELQKRIKGGKEQ